MNTPRGWLRRKRQACLLCLFVSLAALGGSCGVGRSEPSRFYTLEPVLAASGNQTVSRAGGPCFILGVGPVELPGYVDRDQMVSREADNVVLLAEFDRWAAPLDSAIARTLAGNMAELLCADPAVAYPWPEGVRPDWQVAIQVTRHECRPRQECRLEASWAVLDRRLEVRATGVSHLSQPLQGGSYAAMAGTLSALHGEMAKQMAAGVERARQAKALP